MVKKLTKQHRCKVCGSLGRPYTDDDYKYTYGNRPKKKQYHLKAMTEYDRYYYPHGYYLCEEHYKERMKVNVNSEIDRKRE